jgi:hypothetical protein
MGADMRKKKLVLITAAIWMIFSLLALSLGGCGSMSEFNRIIIGAGRPQVRQCLMGIKVVPCQNQEIVGR